ncbi:dystroglycan 1-like [Argiope bruennichi]|uniref:dystroglycan 1-like n=1 Tax=Argiope bruennichi TaxID=94029 RepID=UPI0024958933|nr:dystroglycan 1-like [Argiope bruennichi]XP_055935298.1 dystroglycan 1-like [Argiope bruennichi]
MTKSMRGPLPLLYLWVIAYLAALSTALQRNQGITDTRAHVGRIFRLQIPKNAFEGTIERYEVTEAGESSLPSWLEFDPEQQLFTGVPGVTDSGQLYVCIKVIAGSSTAKDVFSIEITDDSPADDYCQFGKEETTATIVIDATLSDLKPSEKFHMLQAIASHFNLPESRFRISALHRDESSFDPSAVRAGPGNALERSHEGTQIQFRVGCSGDISSEYEPIIANLEKSAANGELADLIGHMIVGWQVSGTNRGVTHIRDKRNVTPFHATPVPKMHVTRWPTYTERIIDEAETREIVPSMRIVPTMSSPHFIDRTNFDHRHRHHHGQDVLRRQNIFPTAEILASPTYRYHPFPTKQASGATPLPTPVLYPDRPTTPVVPTRIYEIDGTVSVMKERTVHVSEDILSRWYVLTSDFTTADIKPTRSRTTVEPTRTMPKMPNFKPTVSSRTKKLSLVAGKAWRYEIPSDTFVDMEDGNTKDLKLMFMTSERTSLPSASWIQFDPETQVIYALPLSENIGKHEFVLEAMDSEGASTFDRVELHVWQHPEADKFTHTFTMTVRYNKWQYPVGIDWQIEILNRLARLFKDPDNSKLSVIRVTLDPVKILWSNDTLATSHCPFEDIKRVYDVFATFDHHPTKEMKKFMSPEFRVQDINVKYEGACHGVVTTSPPPLNAAPILRNSIGRINVTVGDIIKFKVPENTFFDFEDGATRQLRLSLLTPDNVQPPKSYWVQFDPRSQEIYGIASEREIGTHDFLLNAVDSDDRSVADAFVIHVSTLSRRVEPPVEFSVELNYDFDEFFSDTDKKTLVASKIARLYGDPDPRHMVILNITRGSVVYAWSNKTLDNETCPKDKIEELVKCIINDDGTLSNNLIEMMRPEFEVIGADAVPKGMCLGSAPPTFVTITTTTPAPPPPEDLEPTLKTSTDDDIYITTIVPAIVIAVMLVIAAVVAYFLYWKKRKGKMSLGDKDFIGSGVPVVFAGELEEQKPDLGKAPAIMKNEKPPLSTDYLFNPFRRGTAAVRDSAPPTAAKTRDIPPLRERKETSSLYKPPPPFASNRESKSTRPKSTQAYRHATYVPP